MLKLLRKCLNIDYEDFRRKTMTNAKGRFGIHGGQYIPETLMNAVIQLEEAYKAFVR